MANPSSYYIHFSVSNYIRYQYSRLPRRSISRMNMNHYAYAFAIKQVIFSTKLKKLVTHSAPPKSCSFQGKNLHHCQLSKHNIPKSSKGINCNNSIHTVYFVFMVVWIYVIHVSSLWTCTANRNVFCVDMLKSLKTCRHVNFFLM